LTTEREDAEKLLALRVTEVIVRLEAEEEITLTKML
jgi:hypothetical protein